MDSQVLAGYGVDAEGFYAEAMRLWQIRLRSIGYLDDDYCDGQSGARPERRISSTRRAPFLVHPLPRRRPRPLERRRVAAPRRPGDRTSAATALLGELAPQLLGARIGRRLGRRTHGGAPEQQANEREPRPARPSTSASFRLTLVTLPCACLGRQVESAAAILA